ncbi:fimbrial protein [Paraburkholderia solisilvae]|uniref:Major fimbrial subunit SMF-1 n=1 Tax=Paraburkholderia solisilvae TaxID=624376 RepID=A0A6J5E6L8_9BURK|nr:fimbrial protein [Paraburkholderia solisilvae]CAB3761031.1 Major fimbrial subunit SMF-1 [Paraburkholderia solisilvae]
MKLRFSTLVLVAGGLVGIASLNAHAADGTITIQGSVSDTTCSINGATSGTPADISVTLPTVQAGSLASAGAVAGTSNAGDIQMVLSGCSGAATKATARFENGSTVDQSSGYLKNMSGTNAAQNVEVRLLNVNMQPINILTGQNNDIDSNGTAITGGSAVLKYFAQYYATGKAQAGSVSTSVQYTMQYQ